jgi:hypothetical protein
MSRISSSSDNCSVAETPGQALMFNFRYVTLVNQDAVNISGRLRSERDQA